MVCQCLADTTGCVDNDGPNSTAWMMVVQAAVAQQLPAPDSCATVAQYCNVPGAAAILQAACPLTCGVCGSGNTQCATEGGHYTAGRAAHVCTCGTMARIGVDAEREYVGCYEDRYDSVGGLRLDGDAFHDRDFGL
eukprot:SAG11_NODE_9880_length_873_cov_0.804910_2_plen_135_part_01